MNIATNSRHPSHHLRLKSEKIIQLWSEQAEIGATQALGRSTFLDQLPAFLESLANSLTPNLPIVDSSEESLSRGLSRRREALPSFLMSRVIQDYSTLRRVIFEVLEAECDLTQQDRNILLNRIDGAVQEIAAAYRHCGYCDERKARHSAEVKFDVSDRARVIAEDGRQESQNTVRQMKDDSAVRENFVALLSHDLRNPIGSAKMALELLNIEKPLSLEWQELSGIMSRNLDVADHMIRDLLDANRIKSGQKLSMDIKHCDVAQVAREAKASLSLLHGGKIVFEGPKNVWGYWDATGLRRVLENLINNGFKYGEKNRAVTVCLEQNATETKIIVQNFGRPIPLAEQAALFDPFYRCKTALEQKEVGWGLGLTLVRGVVEAHAGKIEIKSNAQEGTSFIISVPNDARPEQLNSDLQ